MNQSKRGQPCPICSREKDGDCRWSDDAIFCHQGSSHSAPSYLKLGDTINSQGKEWALVSVHAGYDKSAFLFKPHNNIVPRSVSAFEDRIHDFDLSVRVGSVEYWANEFVDLAQEALDVLEFESASPHELKNCFELIYSAESKGKELIKELTTLASAEKRLKPYIPVIKDLNKQLYYQRKDADSFRKNYLGETLNDC